MEDLSLHILDVAENSIAAGAKYIEIKVMIDTKNDSLVIEINDDGKGIGPEIINKVFDPFYTTRQTRKIGLGLPLLDEATKNAGGKLTVESELGTGTRVTAKFELSNIDRKPLGNMADTLVALLSRNLETSIKYVEEKDGNKFVFDTKEIKSHNTGIAFNSVEVLTFIKKYIDENTIL
jgi:anti-sigma regulatory factor (Ser/Thr protein kinase)